MKCLPGIGGKRVGLGGMPGLRHGQQELLASELHTTQPQSPQPDVVLQLSEQGFHFLPSAQRDAELRRLGALAGALARPFMNR